MSRQWLRPPARAPGSGSCYPLLGKERQVRHGTQKESTGIRGSSQAPLRPYQARVVDPLSQKMVSLGTFKTVAEADRAVALAQADQSRGAWVDPRPGRITLRDYVAKWLSERTLRPRTRQLYEGLLNNHVLPVLGDLEMAKITPSVVRTWHAKLSQGNAPGQVAKCYRLLRTVFTTAVEDELLVRNPCTIKGASVERSPERPTATTGEIKALADAMPPELRLLVQLGAFTGLRPGELLALRRRHVDLLRMTVTVSEQVQELADGTQDFGPPKTDAGYRTVTIPSTLLPDLEHHLANFAQSGATGFLFAGQDGLPVRRMRLRRAWWKARKSIGREDLTLHDLRHSGMTLAARTRGVTTRDLMVRMGHSSAQAALRYQHTSGERDAAIAKSLDEEIRNATPPEVAEVVELRPGGERLTHRGGFLDGVIPRSPRVIPVPL